MTRLLHSPGGLLRALQMSVAQLVILTEGRLDRLFVSGLVAACTEAEGCVTAVRTVREISASGGKKALLAFHDYLRRRRRLQSELAGKHTRVLFFLDKDIDDIRRLKRRSPFVVYTTLFDVESHLFTDGDLVGATAAATTLDRSTVSAALTPVATWTQRVSASWLDWVAVCVFEQKYGVTTRGNYGVCPSPLHQRDGSVDETRLNERLTAMCAASGCDTSSFQERWRAVRTRLAHAFRRGEGDRVFKGKWYAWFVERDIREASVVDCDLGGLERRLPQHLCHTIDFTAEWAEPLRVFIASHAEAARLAA